MKKTLSGLLLIFATYSYADVTSVFIWQPNPGGVQKMYENAAMAKAIHEDMGATVFVGRDQMNNLHYGLTFADWPAWGRFTDALPSSEKWQQFLAQAGNAAELKKIYNMNQPVPGADGNVTVVFSWKVDRGKTGDFVQLAAKAKPIHEKLGASVGINVDELGRVHYVMTYENWEAWGKTSAAVGQSEEWAAFLEEANRTPMADLENVYRITTVQ